jgi:hypothetical protein
MVYAFILKNAKGIPYQAFAMGKNEEHAFSRVAYAIPKGYERWYVSKIPNFNWFIRIFPFKFLDKFDN